MLMFQNESGRVSSAHTRPQYEPSTAKAAQRPGDGLQVKERLADQHNKHRLLTVLLLLLLTGCRQHRAVSDCD
jgi:hypothetical protein